MRTAVRIYKYNEKVANNFFSYCKLSNLQYNEKIKEVIFSEDGPKLD